MEKQPKALAFGPDTVMSRGQDRAVAFLVASQAPDRQLQLQVFAPPQPGGWKSQIRAGLVLPRPLSWACRRPSPPRVLTGSPLCVGVPTSSSYRDPHSCGIRAQPSDPIPLFTSVKVTSPNSCILAVGGQDSSTGLCRRRSAHSSGGGGGCESPSSTRPGPVPGGCAQGAPGATTPWGPPPCSPPALASPEGRTPHHAAWLALAEPPRPLVPGTSRPC